MNFDWDEDKNKANIGKHGVSFEKAQRIFEGPVVTKIDSRFDYGEIREISLGMVDGILILAVVHTEQNEDTIRLISARKANKQERKIYESKIRSSSYD
jgi:uncharacterized DUF497 family protein